MKKWLIIKTLIFASYICNQSYAQSLLIYGKVTDEQNQAIPFANVVFESGQINTLTDINGVYNLEIPQAGIVKIKYLGFDEETYSVTQSGEFNFRLKENTKILKEVTIVGYGSLSKSDQTGSSSSFKGKDLNHIPTVSPVQALQSKAPGIHITNSGAPGSSPKVRIRGVGSIFGGADPLYVVDGVITSDIRNINNEDIERMDILKDASSTAIYGARASNGVILITTKKGAKKEFQYNVSTGINFLTHGIKMATPGFYAQYSNDAAGFPAVTQGEVTGKTDWYDAITRIAFQQKHDISFQNKIKKYNFYLSGGFINTNGILIDNSYNRYTLRYNHGLQIIPQLRFDHTLALSFYQSNNKPYSLFSQAYIAAPIYNKTNPDGTFGNTSNLVNNVGNPYATLKTTDDKSHGTRYQSTFSGSYNILKNLIFKSQIGIDLENNIGRRFTPEYFTYQANGIKGAQFNELPDLHYERDTIYQWVWDQILTYEIHSIENQKITLQAGHTAERRDGWRSLADLNNSTVLNSTEFKTLNFNDTTFGQQNIRNPIDNYFRRESYFARLNYKLKEKYILTATYRNDASSNFPSNNRRAQFPAVGIGWILSEENFLKNHNIINELKLRASYGLSGNDVIRPGQFDLRPTERLFSYFGTNRIDGATVIGIIDPNLKWEIVEEFDFGIEFSLLKNKITGEVDYYKKLAKDALFEIPYPSIGFGSSLLTNAADISNQGIEFGINYLFNKKGNWDQKIKFNFTSNKNVVQNVGAGKALNFGSAGNGFTVTQTLEGHPIGSFWVFETDGIFQNEESINNYAHIVGTKPGDFKIIDQNQDGIIDNLDRIHIGSNQPKFFFGIQYEAKYKNWEASIDIYGNYGALVYNAKKGVKFGSNYNTELAVVKNRWTPGSNENENPRASSVTPYPTDYFVESGSFYRINNITIAYNFQNLWTNRYFKSLRFYISSYNPFLFTKYTGFTPELPGNQNESGIELNIYPISTMVILGIQSRFK